MKILNDAVLNIVLMMFPLLVYFIYNCYRELKCEKYNSILLNLSLFTAIYLCLKYGKLELNNQLLLFLNIPILVAYIRKQQKVGITLSIIVLLYSYYINYQTISIMTIKFISYLIIYIIGKRKNINDKTFIILIAIIQGFFTSTEFVLIYKTSNIITT